MFNAKINSSNVLGNVQDKVGNKSSASASHGKNSNQSIHLCSSLKTTKIIKVHISKAILRKQMKNINHISENALDDKY